MASRYTGFLCDGRRLPKSYSLPIALTRAVAQEAERGGVSASEFVTRILAHYLTSGGVMFVPVVGTLDKDTDLSKLFERKENEK